MHNLINDYKTLQLAGIETGQKAAFHLWQQVSSLLFSRKALLNHTIMVIRQPPPGSLAKGCWDRSLGSPVGRRHCRVLREKFSVNLKQPGLRSHQW